MREPLDELYLRWLYSNIVEDLQITSKRRTYWNLARELFTTPFLWLVPNDDARGEDGKELRMEFIHVAEISEVDPDWLSEECSMLEMLIALSRRMAFELDGAPHEWFWHLMRNVELHECTDAYKGDTAIRVENFCNAIVFRQYKPNGSGGLFPLREAHQDQRDVELWYQMNAYVQELDLI